MGHTTIISHRAAMGEAPANTLAGVRAALHSADAMEIDIQLSKDGVPVLMHDPTVDATTNLSGPVRDFTVEELSMANAGDGEHVPTLAEVLQLVQGHLAIFCELKPTPNDPEQDARLVDAFVRVVEEHNATTWTGAHSFEAEILERCRRRQPLLATSLITPPVEGAEMQRVFATALKLGCQAVSVFHLGVNEHLVRAAKFRMLTVAAWTPNEEDEWRRLIDLGVDAIVTDYPSRLRKMLGR
jgi:glycerophosphoryl diester phosphodiesterase